jgi:PIN domain nuclease of toxin-antitoxin system
MSDHVVDTHALYWYLLDAPQLGRAAGAVMDDAFNGNGFLVVPSIVLAELYFINVKHRRPLDFAAEFQWMLSTGRLVFVDFQAADILQFDALATIPEIHDRIIVGVALARSIPILTRDAAIVSSGLVPNLW